LDSISSSASQPFYFNSSLLLVFSVALVAAFFQALSSFDFGEVFIFAHSRYPRLLKSTIKMRYALLSSLIAGASAHCVITAIQGANGVTMPGLSGKTPSASSFQSMKSTDK
jgi:hypothetical protein